MMDTSVIDLPLEILQYIFVLVEASPLILCQYSTVCKAFRAAANGNELWRPLGSAAWGVSPQVEGEWKRAYMHWVRRSARMGKMTTTQHPRKRDRNYDFLAKLLIIGDSSVGKTSMLRRYSHGTFGVYDYTIGVDFQIVTKEFFGSTIKLQMWDTAGAERFNFVSRRRWRGAHGVAIAFDLTCRESFRRVQYWFEQAKEHAPDKSIVLWGLKSDLVSPCASSDDARAVSTHEALDLARTLSESHVHPIEYREASAKNDIGVSDAYDSFAECVAAQQLLFGMPPYPRYRPSIEDLIAMGIYNDDITKKCDVEKEDGWWWPTSCTIS